MAVKPDQASLAVAASQCCASAADLMLIAFADGRPLQHASRLHTGQTACELARALSVAIAGIEGASEFRLEELRKQIAKCWKAAADIPITPALRPTLSVHTGDRPHERPIA